VLIGGNTFKWKFIERDEEIISMLIQLESDFWEHVQTNVPPPLDGSEASAKFLNERFPISVPASTVELPCTAAALIKQYDTACEQLSALTDKKTEAENLLKQMMGDNEVGSEGERFITWKSVTQERLDSKTLKAEHPVLYKKYANQTSYRRFSVKSVTV
jgi:predicted phage-related endonuclease